MSAQKRATKRRIVSHVARFKTAADDDRCIVGAYDLAQEILRHLAAVLCELLHHFFVQPHVHGC